MYTQSFPVWLALLYAYVSESLPTDEITERICRMAKCRKKSDFIHEEYNFLTWVEIVDAS